MSAIPPPHYVRLRRYNLSIFVHCDVHNDTVQAIKERYGKLTGHIFYNARLYLGQQSLDDFLTLYGCGIEAEGAELVVVHSKGAKGDGTSEHIWETVEEAMAAPQGDSLNSPEVTAEGTAKLDSMEAAATSNEVGNQQQQQAADARGGTGAELNVGNLEYMSFDMEVLREALLRAQYSRRTIPQLSDFPTCVSEEEVQQIYLPFLADEESQVRKGLAVGSVEIIGYRRSEELTIAGDCIAAALPVASILSNAPYLL